MNVNAIKKALGWLRKVLNALNAAGYIPSQKPTVKDKNDVP